MISQRPSAPYAKWFAPPSRASCVTLSSAPCVKVTLSRLALSIIRGSTSPMLFVQIPSAEPGGPKSCRVVQVLPASVDCISTPPRHPASVPVIATRNDGPDCAALIIGTSISLSLIHI